MELARASGATFRCPTEENDDGNVTGHFKREMQRFLLHAFRPVLIVIAIAAGEIYKAAVAWWLDPLIERRHRNAFSTEIRTVLAPLFEAKGARIVPNTRRYPSVADYAVVTVAVGHMLLRFVRGRDDFRVDVAPVHAPGDWQEIGEAIASCRDERGSPDLVRYYRLQDFGRLLEANFEMLERALSRPRGDTARRDASFTRLTRL